MYENNAQSIPELKNEIIRVLSEMKNQNIIKDFNKRVYVELKEDTIGQMFSYFHYQ